MNKALVALLALVLVVAAFRLPDRTSSADLDQIRETIDHYFMGHATGDGAHFEQAFHPEAKLFWVRDGELHQRTSAEFAAGASGSPAADETQRQRRIVNIDVSGDAAVVKVELDYPGALIHDYMSMLKIDGTWKIVNKTFVVHPRGN